ncbi:MAG TPA: 6-carboxytetrahydropterin synthase [Gemmatimonadales bacterium]|nr:6-carboxytetrahydropterin synthase [Gemmatimonadales bacterium]
MTRRVHFNAAHRLHNPKFSEEWNRATFGKCANPNFHGHNYELEVTVEGEIEPETGYVFDLTLLHKLTEERIIRHLDHRNLNVDVPWFQDLIPSAENIAVVCWRQLCPALPAGLALRVRLWETPRNYVEYDGR